MPCTDGRWREQTLGVRSTGAYARRLCSGGKCIVLTDGCAEVRHEILRDHRPTPRHLEVHLLALRVKEVLHQLSMAGGLLPRLASL